MDVATIALGGYLTVLTGLIGWLVVRRLDRIPTREELDARFDGVDKRFDAVDKRFDGVDKRFDGVDKRFERIESDVAVLRSDLTHIALAVGARTRPQTG